MRVKEIGQALEDINDSSESDRIKDLLTLGGCNIGIIHSIF